MKSNSLIWIVLVGVYFGWTSSAYAEDILEIDSLAHITLISLIKDSFGVDIKAEDFSKFDTLKDVVSKIGEANFAQ